MEAVRDGGTQREVARRFGVGLATVQLWLDRAGDRPLDAVDWEDRPSVRRRSSRTSEGMEEVVLETRRTRREESVLGEDGAEASARPSRKGGNLPGPLPSTRTIGRILEPRGGGLDAPRAAGALRRVHRGSRARHAVRLADAPPRRLLAPGEPIDPRRPASGHIVFLRRTTDRGAVTILNRRRVVDRAWVHRLVRAELDDDAGRIDVFALRRRDPAHQPQLAGIPYDPPDLWFR